MQLVKVLNPDKANDLVKLGFNYTLENNGSQKTYVFVETTDLLKHIQCNFTKKDYFISNTLNF